MPPVKPLTKCLHTYTSATNVAKYLHERHTGDVTYHGSNGAAQLAIDALQILGYSYNLAGMRAAVKSDPLVGRIYQVCVDILAA